MDKLEIWAEITPNPHTLKFNVNQTLLETGAMNFTDRQKAKDSYLAGELFSMESVIGVLVGKDFITVTKAPAADWQPLIEPIINKIKECLSSGKALFSKEAVLSAHAGGDSEIEKKIKEVLDREIRPAVAMDGGDLTFYSYENGVVTLHLQGACSSCPSSIMTLKMGVENRLKALIPEVKEVVQV
jgi:Fe-S cluster biogenesis protein NfuA